MPSEAGRNYLADAAGMRETDIPWTVFSLDDLEELLPAVRVGASLVDVIVHADSSGAREALRRARHLHPYEPGDSLVLRHTLEAMRLGKPDLPEASEHFRPQ